MDPTRLKPHLLLNTSVASPHYLSTIIDGPYKMTSPDLPMGRFRGTVFDIDESAWESRKVVGWQRNVSRMGKADISLPTVISLMLDSAGTIKGIELHRCFRGSKGFLCSWSYLNNTLQEKLLDVPMDTTFKRRITLEALPCFHLVEVVLGIYGYYRSLGKRMDDLATIQSGIHYEQEVTECYRKDRDIYAVCKYQITDKVCVDYLFRFQDLLDNVAFDPDGSMTGLENTKIQFFVNDQRVLDNHQQARKGAGAKRDLLAFLLKARDELKKRVYPQSKLPFYNTNLHPSAIMGLVIQAVGMHIFSNNYNYNMHVLTALQRSYDRPKCIGAIRSDDEARRYFPFYRVK